MNPATASSNIQFDHESLEYALSYEGDVILRKFLMQFDVSMDEARMLFMDVKRWLWLCARHHEDLQHERVPSSSSLVIPKGLIFFDEMWHTFILFTKEYAEYCNERFGQFIHHAPFVPPEPVKPKTNEERAEESKTYHGQLQWQIAYCYDLLGHETTIRWYAEYPSKYPRDKVMELRVA